MQVVPEEVGKLVTVAKFLNKKSDYPQVLLIIVAESNALFAESVGFL